MGFTGRWLPTCRRNKSIRITSFELQMMSYQPLADEELKIESSTSCHCCYNCVNINNYS